MLELLAFSGEEDRWVAPHYTTGRLWLMQLGYYELCREKSLADDWVWMVDHSAQIGVEKCLVILGIRLSELPPVDQCLQHEDMELIELLPVKSSNQDLVRDQLEEVSQRTGIVPRAIVEDHGSDLRGGVAQFCERHTDTAQIYDIKHKAACVLKKQLEKDVVWDAFTTCLGQTKFKVQQTELAFLVPPSQRSKSRWMNLTGLTRWARETLSVLDSPSEQVLEYCAADNLETHFGWLREYRSALREWCAMQRIVDLANDFVRTKGLFQHAADELTDVLQPWMHCRRSREIGQTLIEFIQGETSQIREGERLPGSTEVLESSFAKLKSLERHQSKSGFTGLVLGLGAIVSNKSTAIIRRALESVSISALREWIASKIGATIQAKRRNAFKNCPRITSE